MRKNLCLLLILISGIVLSQNANREIDSLQNILGLSQNKKWVDAAVELSFKLRHNEPNYSEELITEAIELSKRLDYKYGLANAYMFKGQYSYDNNKVLSGLTFYQKSYEIYNKINKPKKAANSIYGIGEGLSRIHKTKESNDTLKFALDKYIEQIEPSDLSDFYQLLSSNYKDLGNQEYAIAYIDTAIIIEQENQLTYKLVNSYNSLGIIHSDIGNYKQSIFNYDKCEYIARQLNDTLSISYAISNKALIYLDWGVYDEALSLFLQGQELTQALGLEKELSIDLSNIALVYQETKDLNKAKTYYQRALRLAEEYGQDETVSIIQHNLGDILYTEGNYDSALILLNKSMRYEMNNNRTLGIAQSKSMIANVYVAMGKYPLAFSYFEDAKSVFEKFGSKLDLANLFIDYAKAHETLLNDSLSVEYYNKGLEIAIQINATNIIQIGYEAASKNYERLEDFKQALYYYKAFKELNDTIYNEHVSSRIDYMSLKLENQEREKDLEKLANEQKVFTLENQTKRNRLFFIIIVLIIILVFFVWLYFLNQRSQKQIKQQYNVLLESEQKIKALLDASFDSTILVDIHGEIITANSNDLNGFLPDQANILNKSIFSFFKKTNRVVLEKFSELVLSSKTYKELHVVDDKNIFNIKISPIIDMNQNIVSLAFYIKDITQIEKDKKEKRVMESQLIQTQKMETVGTMAGGIAHDFNNYLATIKGYVDMSLEDIETDHHVHTYLTNTMKAVTLSQQTVQKLLTFSRGKDIIMDKISFDQLLTDSIDIIKGSKPKNIDLIYPNEEFNIELLADKNQITQVIINIITNAFHAIDDHNGSVKIEAFPNMTLAEFDHKKMICLKISDDGIGMDKETIQRVFEPFFTTKEVGKGTGLGLSVVTGIVKQHNGKITVESEFGKGTIFSLYLPII
ncbi:MULTISPECIES: tetratricopeptide repeat protein [unclassified Lentimicrobium]|uniref:tetratricopeptide repeat protein n=1 Tax=unclassified Lentimicrobium TaxID=2677434 RepID=UPI0015532BF3|nr:MULTISPECIES: tetratricopeptide repeat protein [unclassified Lentimicrobium]NPD45154.1 tetratricopeptide repeat protein [Lentimicrobium sp. S6]NPD84512.1 tetratricopeptide repeat protein [Lentimicrobium sp. L6]